VVSVPGSALPVGVGHAGAAGCSDGFAVAVVFVVGGDIAEGFMEAHGSNGTACHLGS